MTVMSSSTPAPSITEEKPRSRNAKAQARHRAKRKAYIEQLEQTVTKLQAALGYSPEQVSALPPSSITIRELQQDNHQLQKENEELRRALAEATGGRRTAMAPYPDPRGGCDRGDYRRRKQHMDPGYTNDSHHGERPPPLQIPNSTYSGVTSTNTNNGSLFSMHGSGFIQNIPNTPSGSSATSSPPFSPTMQMQTHLDQRPLTGSMPHYSQNGHYNSSVKVEDEPSYQASHGNHHQSSINYSYSNQSHNGAPPVDWHGGYSSERAQLHR